MIIDCLKEMMYKASILLLLAVRYSRLCFLKFFEGKDKAKAYQRENDCKIEKRKIETLYTSTVRSDVEVAFTSKHIYTTTRK